MSKRDFVEFMILEDVDTGTRRTWARAAFEIGLAVAGVVAAIAAIAYFVG